MSVKAKIVAYNYKEADNQGCKDFSLNMFWGNDYKNVFYLCGDLGRSTFEDIIETETDITGQTERTQNTSIERYNLTIIASTPLLQFLKSIDKHDVKELHYLETGDIYTIKNIDIEDDGDRLTPANLVTIIFEDEAITKITDSVFTLDTAKQAFWDNNNDGVKDIDGEAQHEPITAFSSVFNVWQLYYESDGITPATSGDILITVYATNLGGIESLLGIFRGSFGDSFSDSSKWQSTQQIWDYFNLSDTVGHTNRCQFNKRAFATANGYLSDELEDRAVDIRFNISIDGSTPEPTTLALVYTLWGAFHSAGVQDPVTANYGYTTIGKILQKNTLNTLIDNRTPQPAATPTTTITSAVLQNVTNFSNRYVLDNAPNGEHSYSGLMTTPIGYVGENSRGSYDTNNFTLGPNDAAIVSQALNILNFTLGGDPHIFTFNWKYDRIVSGNPGSDYPALGDVVAGTAEILLDGIQIADISASVSPSPLVNKQAFGVQGVTLPDTQVHEVKLQVETDTGFNIFTSFEVQIKPYF